MGVDVWVGRCFCFYFDRCEILYIATSGNSNARAISPTMIMRCDIPLLKNKLLVNLITSVTR